MRKIINIEIFGLNLIMCFISGNLIIMSTKKPVNIQSIIGIIVGMTTFFLVQQYFFKAPEIDEVMMKAASELNKSCPFMVDEETRLDNTISLPDKIFQYNYTLVNLQIEDIDIDAMVSYLEPGLINNVRTNPDMKYQRDSEVTLAYVYKDRDGVFLTKILVTPDKYQE
jgi:hypothetical protein